MISARASSPKIAPRAFRCSPPRIRSAFSAGSTALIRVLLDDHITRGLRLEAYFSNRMVYLTPHAYYYLVGIATTYTVSFCVNPCGQIGAEIGM